MAPPIDIERPLPDVSERMRPFYDATRSHKLVVQRCDACSRTFFPAVDICSDCHSDALSWIECCGKGEVFSYVIMHHVYHPAFAARTPYAVAEVKLDEGPRMRSNIVDIDAVDLRIGLRVEATYECFGKDLWLPLFRPDPSR